MSDRAGVSKWLVVGWCAAGVVAAAGVIFLIWWLWTFPTDEAGRGLAIQVAQVAIGALGLLTAIAAAVAAHRSSVAAEASAEMVERVRSAMAYHNRPEGSLGFHCPQAQHRYDNRPPSPLGDSVINYIEIGDTVTATVTLRTATGAPMSGLRLTYVARDERTHSVLLTNGQPSPELVGVSVVGHGRPEHMRMFALDIRSLTVECVDPETTTTWRSTHPIADLTPDWGAALTFDRTG